MSAYLDYHLKSSQSDENSNLYLDLTNPDHVRRLREALELMRYCPSTSVICRITTKGSKLDLVSLLEETDLPFNQENIIVTN